MVYTMGKFRQTTTVTRYTIPALHTVFTGAVRSHGLYTSTTVYQHRGLPSNRLPRLRV
jgi:hypothetical protein